MPAKGQITYSAIPEKILVLAWTAEAMIMNHNKNR
jgi:hypothetical protein